MKVYHRTHHANEILASGFRDGRGRYMTSVEWTGVWLSDQPDQPLGDAEGDTLLSLDIPEDVLLPYEWREERKGYREFLVPADLVNRYGPPIEVDA